jgi:hypothetical protein
MTDHITLPGLVIQLFNSVFWVLSCLSILWIGGEIYNLNYSPDPPKLYTNKLAMHKPLGIHDE